jgi:hypothetical protein
MVESKRKKNNMQQSDVRKEKKMLQSDSSQTSLAPDTCSERCLKLSLKTIPSIYSLCRCQLVLGLFRWAWGRLLYILFFYEMVIVYYVHKFIYDIIYFFPFIRLFYKYL